jgi:Protein of unknown function (DUF3667)
MENSCIHCSSNFSENFCNYCGQKKYKRIDRKYIWDEIQYTLVHVNKGFLYSVKSIISNPGKMARAFVDGDRVNHYKPISLVFILATISAFFSITIVKLYEKMGTFMIQHKLGSAATLENMSFVNKYNSYIMILFVPIVAIFTKWVFRKWGHNYYEHIIMNAIGVSLYLIWLILLMYPILYFVKDNNSLFMQITAASFLIIPIFMVIFFKEFYAEKPLKTVILKVLLLVLLLLVSYFAVIFIGTISFIIIKGPAAMKALQVK